MPFATSTSGGMLSISDAVRLGSLMLRSRSSRSRSSRETGILWYLPCGKTCSTGVRLEAVGVVARGVDGPGESRS